MKRTRKKQNMTIQYKSDLDSQRQLKNLTISPFSQY